MIFFCNNELKFEATRASPTACHSTLGQPHEVVAAQDKQSR